MYASQDINSVNRLKDNFSFIPMHNGIVEGQQLLVHKVHAVSEQLCGITANLYYYKTLDLKCLYVCSE